MHSNKTKVNLNFIEGEGQVGRPKVWRPDSVTFRAGVVGMGKN